MLLKVGDRVTTNFSRHVAGRFTVKEVRKERNCQSGYMVTVANSSGVTETLDADWLNKVSRDIRPRLYGKGEDCPEDAVSIMRPGPWGNKFTVREYGRAEAVRLHREQVLNSPTFMAAIRRELRGKDLVCCCGKKQACHGSIYLEVANSSDCICLSGLTRELN